MEASAPNPNSLRWDHTPEEIKTLADKGIADWTATVDGIIALKEERTYKNTIEPLAKMEYDSSCLVNNLEFYHHASADADLREASLAAEKKFDDYSIELWMRYDLYEAMKSYKDTAVANKEWDSLDAESQRYVDRILRDFNRNGMGFPQEKREQIKALLTKISDLERDCSNNINNDKTKVEFEEKDLEGLPAPILSKLEKVEGKEGSRYVSMKYPEVLPALKLCKNEETRRKLSLAYNSRCVKENIPLLEDLVAKRHEVAQLLGYKSYSEYILEIRMAKSPINVQNFEQSLLDKLKKAGGEEFNRLQQLKRDETGNPDAVLQGWDRSFYTNILKEKFYSIDEEKIKEYFPTNHVVEECMKIYQELLSLKFTPVPGVKLWHEDASCYQVQDASSGETIGHFCLDLYPRDNKFGHAAVFPQLKRAKVDGKVIPAAASMLCNFDTPTKERPSTLPHSDVVTFFHEFGHVMHGMCSTANYSRFSGTSVERDFVELPSQMLENWAWNKDILKRVSKHFETGEPLPDDLIEKKISIKNLLEATFTLRQQFYGTFDFLLHSANDENLLGLDESSDSFHIGQHRKKMKKDGLKIDTYDLWHTLTKEITLGEA